MSGCKAVCGCQIQELSYEKQLEFKEKKVRGNLERIGGLAPEELDEVMEPICGMEDRSIIVTRRSFRWNRQTRAYCDRILCRTDPSDYSKHRVCSWRKTEQRNLEMIVDFMNYITYNYDETNRRRTSSPCADPLWISDWGNHGLPHQ